MLYIKFRIDMITRELLDKFLDGRCSQDELALLKKYLLSGKTSELNRILEEDWKLAGRSGADRDIGVYRERILGRLREELYDEQSAMLPDMSPRRRWQAGRWYMAAAVSCCLLAFGGYFFREQSSGKTAYKEEHLQDAGMVTERRNDGSEPLAISLSDGSRVVLEPKSTLHFPATFQDGERQVWLEGKAFFEVAKDSLHPFLVKTNSLNVKVLGTSFNVSSFEDKPAEVSVITGKVAVFVAEQRGSLILQPNERAVRLNENAKLAKMLVEEPVILKREALANLFDFDETPVSQVFEALEKAYNITIRFDQKQIKHCTLRARLDDQPLFVKLDMICASLGLEYEIVGTDIVINGEGCYDDHAI